MKQYGDSSAASNMKAPSKVRLSICIGTFNRAALLGATLQSVLTQVTEECEIVVSDNASTDKTEEVVAEYGRRTDRLRYFRQATNVGLDKNFDHTVELAQGEYCWLVSDDDLVKPGAVKRVLDALRSSPSLVVVNIEYMDFSMSKLVQRRATEFDSDRVYSPDDMDRLFSEIDQDVIMYIGSTVIRREIWLSRERARYYDTLFIQAGIIFQKKLPGETLAIAEPLISYRLGNAQFTSKLPEIVYRIWPTLVESLAVSESAKRKASRAQPWRNPQWLLVLRGWGFYSLEEYRRWIRPRLTSMHDRFISMSVALLPGTLVNASLLVYFSVRGDRGRWVQTMKRSRFYCWSRRKLM